MKPLRCAIYTRKSSEEGLEQDFNSLAAQREACEAYVKSQAGEGWRRLAAHYDDGGFSGGSLQRPALQRLLDDIAAGKVDVVVVYKVDRLTRSLMDFSKIVEKFEAKGVFFVSVTQSFNTTSSMGRLTLNVLLSFAQFEREVTGERIRDKIAASKQKGMWMGGSPPLGYAADGRTLKITDEEAALVRRIFARYLTLKSVPALTAELEREGVRSRSGAIIRHGAVRHALRNRTYLGQIVHKDKVYPGLHPPIIDVETFDQVQAVMAANTAGDRAPAITSGRTSLHGLVFDDAGRQLIATATFTRGERYRYFAPKPINGRPARGLRVPAQMLEDAVRETTARIFGDKTPTIDRIVASRSGTTIRFHTAQLDMTVAMARLAKEERLEAGEDGIAMLQIPLSFRKWRGSIAVLDLNGQPASPRSPDPALAKAVARAWQWRDTLLNGETESFADIAREAGLARGYVRRITRLAYLAPDLVRLIASGNAPAALCVDRVMRADLPRDWSAQRRMFGIEVA